MLVLHWFWATLVAVWVWSFATPVHAMFASYCLGSAWNILIRLMTRRDWAGFQVRHPGWARAFQVSKAIFGDWWGAGAKTVEAVQAKLKARAEGGDAPPPPPVPLLVLLAALAVLAHQGACTPLTAPARTPYGTVSAMSGPGRCQSLSDRATTWEAVAVGAGAVAGVGGLGGLQVDQDQKGARTAVALTAVGMAGVAAAAAVIAHDDAARFVQEGCGQ